MGPGILIYKFFVCLFNLFLYFYGERVLNFLSSLSIKPYRIPCKYSKVNAKIKIEEYKNKIRIDIEYNFESSQLRHKSIKAFQ